MRNLLDGGNGEIKIANYGPWASVKCDVATQTTPGSATGYFEGDAEYVPGQMMTPSKAVAYKGGSLAQCAASNSSCSPAALQKAGFTSSQANIMSCIAVTESSGNPSTPPYNTTHAGSNSSACGLFQITRSTWNTVATGACASFSQCQNAACNIQVAKTLVNKSSYTPWTCKDCNNKAAHCISQYGGK